MRTFRDNSGRTWTISVDVAAVKRARSLAGVDMLDLRGTMSSIERDPVLVCDAVWAVVKPQADQHGVDEESFLASLAGDCIEAATRALLAELVDFSPNPRQRAALRVVLDRTWAATERRLDLLEADLPRVIDEIDRTVAGSAPPSSGGRSTGSPGSSASIPIPSPSGSSA